ncbi:MAG: cyclic nucleotide-binding domain-containing protein [Thermodesulfobacteriota bacterium]
METEFIVETVAGCELFKGIPEETAGKIVSLCRPGSFDEGYIIFQQGDFGESLYIIGEGLIILERSIDLATRKGTVTIDSLGKGRVLGSWSTLLGEPHILMSSAICRKASTVLEIKGKDLRGMMISDKNLGFAIMEKFCLLLRNRLRAAYVAMEKI